MGKKNVRIPDDDELVRLASAACESAARKLRAATLLFDGGQWAEAFANAALGFEELGKAQLCMTVVGIPLPYRSDFPARQFDQWFNGHTVKAGFAHLVLRGLVDQDAPAAVADLMAEVDAAAARSNETKFRGLYVDLAADGSLLHPDDVSEADACWMVERLQRLLAWMGPIFADMAEDPGFLVFLGQYRDGLDADALAAAIDSGEDDFWSQMRAAVQGLGPVPGWLTGALPDEIASVLESGGAG
ncbi:MULTISPECIES: AbiV family abortive infection protein [Streptacidiphilus]|uniref:AbiV family abortive infection protein n=1 Tax=Streptacidiphilus cavernicola TaxID=3342716 RepID=A0ABV6UWF0_9ACTN|nr:AbiV family abortive infection protein [Streptacidiphilus jeojiense]